MKSNNLALTTTLFTGMHSIRVLAFMCKIVSVVKERRWYTLIKVNPLFIA